jgi:hypothetical protein
LEDGTILIMLAMGIMYSREDLMKDQFLGNGKQLQDRMELFDDLEDYRKEKFGF